MFKICSNHIIPNPSLISAIKQTIIPCSLEIGCSPMVVLIIKWTWCVSLIYKCISEPVQMIHVLFPCPLF